MATNLAVFDQLTFQGFSVLSIKPKAGMCIDWSAVPSKSGVYIFLDESGSAIYVGQSRSLKERVRRSHIVSNERRSAVTIG